MEEEKGKEEDEEEEENITHTYQYHHRSHFQVVFALLQLLPLKIKNHT